MRGFNDENATLINVALDENGKPQYYKTYLKNIDWQEKVGVKFLKTTGSSADIDNKITVFINFGTYDNKNYISAKQFQLSNNKDSYYTFNEGQDFLIRGLIEDEIKSSKDLKALNKKFDVFKIVNVARCDLTKHFEVGCD